MVSQAGKGLDAILNGSSSALKMNASPYVAIVISLFALAALITLTFKRFDRFYYYLDKYKLLYALIVPAYVFTIIFAFLPMGGLIVAFKDYDMWKGFFASPWAKDFGFAHFKSLFTMKPIFDSIGATVTLSALNMLISFPMPIIFALLLNELRKGIFKKVVQTVSYMPNFLSWISVIGLCMMFFSDYGPFNDLMRLFDPGRDRVLYLSRQEYFLPFLLILNLWKVMGFNSIIFLASITGVDTQLYEAASIDGAGRSKQIWHITLPAITPTIAVMFILNIGSIMSSNFELVYGLKNPFIRFDTIDTVVYTYGLQQRGYSLATALGLTRGLIALGLTVLTNWISRKLGDVSVF
jgi:putative aldouronate transport system permease protein